MLTADPIQQYYNIPLELRALNQWCLWRLEDIGANKPTKIPYQINGELANVNDPSTWASFEQVLWAKSNVRQNVIPYSGIGFVFHSSDPFCFIDLDDNNGDPAILDRHMKIFREFDSYAETSPSGKGLHIIIRGQIPQGRRRSNIEVYSSQRYATMTGNVFNSKPITDYQEKLTLLFEQMGNGPSNFQYSGDEPESNEDKAIIEMASRALNGEKFLKLLNANWADLYSSQSEADLSFIDMLAFYTKNRNQITRIFRQSPLGARKKAKRDDYINRMIDRSFDRMLPLIDIDGFKIASENFQPVSQVVKAPLFESGINGSNPLPATNFRLTPPPGLMGDIARFIYDASPRQVPETSIAAAIGLMAGVCGKAYNVSRPATGLNQYIILIGNTGIGKEGMASGISKLMQAIRFSVPTSERFVGPGHISSGQALVKYVNENPCFVSVIGEFAFRLQSICDPRSSGSEKILYQVLLDLYNKSGFTDEFKPSIYADKEKNVTVTYAPAFSILAESTPDVFYGILNEDMIGTGLMPRFTVIEYKGKVPYLNKNAISEPSQYLIDQFSALVAQCEQLIHKKRAAQITISQDAQELFDKLEKLSTDNTNETSSNYIRHLWNRVHLKAMKIAGLIAVGINPIEPTITTYHVDNFGQVHNIAQWAIDLVMNDVMLLSSKFDQGQVGSGTGEIKQLHRTRFIIREYLHLEQSRADAYKVPTNLFNDKIVPASYLSRRLASHTAFQNDRMGSTIALKRAIQALIDSDTIREIPPSQMIEKYGTKAKAYVVSNVKGLGE